MSKPVIKSAMHVKKKSGSSVTWEKSMAQRRGPKPAYSAAAIGQYAIQIADREGLEAVTMQRVAREVGVTTMALYRYFPGKADLLAVMIDCAGGALPKFRSASDWRDRAQEWARCCAAIYRRHPWFLEATTVRRTVIGPNEVSWMEAALALLGDAGLSSKECYFAFLTIMGHIRGHATFAQIKSSKGAGPKDAREFARLVNLDTKNYSAVKAALGAGAFSQDSDEAFEFGLNCILSGIGGKQRQAKTRKTR